jgi:hypothetical protein
LQPHTKDIRTTNSPALGLIVGEPIQQIDENIMTEKQMLNVLRAVRGLTPVSYRGTQDQAPPDNKGSSATVLTGGGRQSVLSAAGYAVLSLLDKGCAYQVHGRWRFRGRHSCVRDVTFVPLLANGFAERVKTERHLEIRITPAGRSVNQESNPRQSRPHSRDHSPSDS